MMGFNIGDNVEVIDDTTEGVVVEIKGSLITVESNEGFLLEYDGSELIKVAATDTISVTNHDVAEIMAEKEFSKKRKLRPVKPKERNAPKMVVDLHIHQLVKFSAGMSSHEMLNIQLDAAKRQLEFAMRKRIPKVVFIHGVGEGILKEELYYLFKRYDAIKCYDADYQKYGSGATEVYIFQSLS